MCKLTEPRWIEKLNEKFSKHCQNNNTLFVFFSQKIMTST